MATIRFHDALRQAAQALERLDLPPEPAVRLVRDLYGRLRFAVDCAQDDYPLQAREQLLAAQLALGAYATNNEVLFRDSFSYPEKFFTQQNWLRTMVPMGCDEDGEPLPDVPVWLLDRMVTGHDWLQPSHTQGKHPHRLVFFGLKGGVGRSTALCMVAWGLARQGKRVLLVDFDLESPGLSGLILPAGRVAEFGVMDWLVEDAVGQGDGVLPGLVSASPLGETTQGAVRVAAAMGAQESDYLAKLARAYADVPSEQGPQRLGVRLRRMVEALEAREQPDVVLIDSRAGLHDLAAAAITSLADTALLFATDSEQTWQGYRQLFSHWQRRVDVVRDVRERLAFVRALTPKSNRESGVKRFQRKAYELFAETLYDAIPPGDVDADVEYFHPAETDEAAPHFPILVDWDERFQEFDPALRPEQGGASDAQVDATFGALIQWVTRRIHADNYRLGEDAP
ncbi:ParA family protein [Comamonas aquatica]|uniref:ParA family protein n=1 Tax=Comamonas aquatica TaxID=225991 RepID=UPI0009F18840|nr:AAA family ATPase [Comamonas aquatica]MDH0202128.1 ParA family protein [Comamonas aquatica]MDH1447237.1 ParA family protein [Comamonas aquatica]MDH1813887.1 ParA family protein [Comamonas aquatica]